MTGPIMLLLFLLLLLGLTNSSTIEHGHDGRNSATDFSNDWVVSLEKEDADSAQLIALKLGYEYMGEIPGFPNHYLMRKLDHPEASDREADMHTKSLEDEVRVNWAQQLFVKTRVKRRPPSSDPVFSDNYSNDELNNYLRQLREMLSSSSDEEGERGIPQELLEMWKEEKTSNHSLSRPKNKQVFNDQMWDHQWYLQDTRSSYSNLPELDLRVLPVFELGFTGKGVRVCVLDDGLEWRHDDLSPNYDPEISYDFTNDDSDPTPGYPDNADRFGNVPNSHGTRCAGEVAMVAGNGICGVGIAHGVNIGGIRMLDGKVDDRIEGMSLQYALDKVDIFTASWGPTDDGQTVEAPGRLAQKAFERGTTEGRKGKGIIYVWAAGNGGKHMDNCNCDGYTSSIYTISIGSASQQGQFPWYGEQCASTMAVAYSSGAYTDQKITTTDTNNSCTVSHTGTSAAAPLAAGIIALALEANPNLTWRDVQHLVVQTSSPRPLVAAAAAANRDKRGDNDSGSDSSGDDGNSNSDSGGWKMNAAGFAYNPRFGFGIMDAFKMVTAAQKWNNVGKQLKVEVEANVNTNTTLRSQDAVIAQFAADATVRFLEHVEVRVTASYPVRGAMEVVLFSPSGTASQLLTARPEDKSKEGFKKWRFMSVHFWGEDPSGTWKLYVVDKTSTEEYMGSVSDLKLFLYGTSEAPPNSQQRVRRREGEREPQIDVLRRL